MTTSGLVAGLTHCSAPAMIRTARAANEYVSMTSVPARDCLDRHSTMPTIRPCALPEGALLRKYRERGTYTDCYATEVAWPVSRAEFVEAFYTTAVFKIERGILKWLAAKPSTDMEARQLASGALDAFAAWRVEGGAPDQLLLRDFSGRTRSWLMVLPIENDDGSASTRLYFGSAVVPVVSGEAGQASLGFAFGALMGFHKLYSRVLLNAASARLARQLQTSARGQGS